MNSKPPRSDGLDSASASPFTARPAVGSIGKGESNESTRPYRTVRLRHDQDWVKDVVGAERCGSEAATQWARRGGPSAREAKEGETSRGREK